MPLARESFCSEFREAAGLDRGPDVGHQGLVIVQIVDGIEPRAENLTAAVQVPQIGPAVVLTGVAFLSGFLLTRVWNKMKDTIL